MVQHRNLIVNDWSSMAIDNVINRGRVKDWTDMIAAAGDGEAIRERVEQSVREAVVEIVQGQVDHLTALYDEVPARIDETVRGVLEKVERAAKADALASRNRMQRSLGRVLLNGLVRADGRKELLKGVGVVVGIVALVLCSVAGLSYWMGFDHGRVRGFSAGTE